MNMACHPDCRSVAELVKSVVHHVYQATLILTLAAVLI